MNTILLITLAIVAALALGFLSLKAFKPSGFVSLCNIGEGIWKGRKAFLTSGPVAERYLLGKLGADPAHIDIAGANDVPIGVITDEASGAEAPLNVNLLGSIDETQLMVAAVPINAGDFLVPAANGRVQPMPAAAGKYNVVGRALTSAPAAGETVSADPVFHQRTV